MTGWDVQFNYKPFSNLSEDDVLQITSHALTNGTHATSYKFAFFKSVLDNLFNADISKHEDEFLSYDSLASRFAEIYWNLILHFKLRQMPAYQSGRVTGMELVLKNFCDKYGFDFSDEAAFPFESLKPVFQLELTAESKKIMLRNVVGAFCVDTQNAFYHFDKRARSPIKDGIYFNHDAYLSLVKYKSSFEKLNYFEWIKYLERVNKEEDAYALATKLDASTERANLEAYRKILQAFGQTRCFYCGKILKKGEGLAVAEPAFKPKKSAPVDHFIPWSFIKDDKLWNFVLSCEECNSKKSNILPSIDFVENLKERNEKLSNVKDELVQKDFKNYSHFKIHHIYQSAVFNGFDCNWEP